MIHAPDRGAYATREPSPVVRRCGGATCPPGTCDHTDEPTVRRSVDRAGPAVAPAIVHDVLESSGQPLDGGIRAAMEPRFGHDFGDVRVHADSMAAASARAVQARAYTVGRHVVLGEGRGRDTLAHELAHVVQQSGAGESVPAQLPIGDPGDRAEREADAAAAG